MRRSGHTRDSRASGSSLFIRSEGRNFECLALNEHAFPGDDSTGHFYGRLQLEVSRHTLWRARSLEKTK